MPPSSAILDQSTSAKRINSRANDVGIERPKVRHRHSVKHLKTLLDVQIPFLSARFWATPFSRKPRACPLREQKVAIPIRPQMRLLSACCWAIDDRGKDAQHPERESGDGMFDMHGRVGNNVRNTRDQEKDPRSHTHQKQ